MNYKLAGRGGGVAWPPGSDTGLSQPEAFIPYHPTPKTNPIQELGLGHAISPLINCPDSYARVIDLPWVMYIFNVVLRHQLFGYTQLFGTRP